MLSGKNTQIASKYTHIFKILSTLKYAYAYYHQTTYTQHTPTLCIFTLLVNIL